MAWCPKCRQEFQDEITVCPDCNVPLVETLDKETVLTEMEFFTEEEAAKFVSFLEYSNIQDAVLEKDETFDLFHIRCNEEDALEVTKLFKAFKAVEQEERDDEEEDDVEDTEADNTSHTPYVKKKDQYTDVSSTGIMLIILGILGLGYVALNYGGVLHFLNGIIPYCLNIILFTAATIYGIISLKHADKLKGQIAEEEALRTQLLEWLEEKVTPEFLLQANDPSLPEEANYLRQSQAVKKLLVKEFPDVQENFIESIVEEKLNEE